MQKQIALGGVLLVGLLAACSTPETRSRASEALVQSWPAEVQQQVRAGKIAVGYTKEMVRVALGEPDRVVLRTTAMGTADVWVFFDKGPKFSFGIGVASGGPHSAVGGGVTVGDTGWSDEELMRVVFEGDRVSAIERRRGGS